MKIVVLHGQNHKGSTYNITKLFLDRFEKHSAEIKEFYLNQISHCVGCFNCVMKDEKLCPHRDFIEPIISAIEQADIVIGESPNYCMGMTGQLKTFFDHLAYRWISHRPHPNMKNKLSLAISTTAGAGAKKVTKSIKQQFFYLGIPKTYELAFTVSAMSWDEVDLKRKNKVVKKVDKISCKMMKNLDKRKHSLKSKFMFNVMKSMHKNMDYNPVDTNYWKQNGWI